MLIKMSLIKRKTISENFKFFENKIKQNKTNELSRNVRNSNIVMKKWKLSRIIWKWYAQWRRAHTLIVAQVPKKRETNIVFSDYFTRIEILKLRPRFLVEFLQLLKVIPRGSSRSLYFFVHWIFFILSVSNI